MTDIDLEAIRAREQAATPGPWLALVDVTAEGDIVWVRANADRVDHVDVATVTAPELWHPGDYMADADFIAHARTDVPALIAAVQRRDDAIAAVLALCSEWQAGEWDVAPDYRDVRAAITAHLTTADNPTTEGDR